MGNHHHHGGKGHNHHHHGDWAADDKEMKREERMLEGDVHYKVDDPHFIEMAKWPVILLDTTGSMLESCTAGGTLKRKDLVLQCLQVVVQMLSAADDAEVQPPGWVRGCPVITFNAIEQGVYRGFMHGDNLAQEWPLIQFHGGTHIMDGWRTMLKTYENHFTEKQVVNWPLCLCLIITDGELQDAQEFEEHLKHTKNRLFVEIAVVGYGEDHDKALHHYRHIAHHHHHVRVTAFTGETDPRVIATQLLSLVDPRLIQI